MGNRMRESGDDQQRATGRIQTLSRKGKGAASILAFVDLYFYGLIG